MSLECFSISLQSPAFLYGSVRVKYLSILFVDHNLRTSTHSLFYILHLFHLCLPYVILLCFCDNIKVFLVGAVNKQ